MEPNQNPILKQLQEIVGAKVDISESAKTRAKKEQEMFCKIVDLWDKTWQRGNKMFDEYQIDMGEYDSHFYQMIEGLFIITYGEMKAEIIAWWIYERILEDGELAVIVTEDEVEHEIKNSKELFKFIKKL
jgi:hypothetical protein